ncbi:MAG TPA: Hpt domain-containing protein [Pseudomonadales bacterium]|nr:Hpt domain-containing protein [Pseudomonadales bacterium]
MSNVGNNELWQAFFTEVSEQLDALELILADNDAESSADIHQLFRDFHTIKSSCAMMDFYSMEKIAHASEDYLDLVRKGRVPLTKPAINQLLNGIDWLKSQLKLSKTTGSAPPENLDLVNTLRSLSAAYSSQEKTSPDNEKGRHSDTSNEFIALALSQDEIEEFASACRQELLIGLAPGTEATKIKRSLNKIVSICNLVGFTAISSLLKKYIRLSNPMDDNRAPAVAAAIIDRIATLETLYSVDCGASMLRTAFLDAKFIDFSQLSGRLDYLLDLIEDTPDDVANIENLESLLITLGVNVSLFGYSDLLNFFRYVLQTVRSIRRGDIPDKRSAFYAIRQAVDFPIAEMIQDGETQFIKTELQTRLSDLNYEISNAIHSGGNENIRDNISKIIEVDTEILDLLMPESLLRLHEAISSEKTIYEIDIDIDCDQQLMESLVNCISENGNIIHNRSVFSEKNDFYDKFSNFICFIAAFEKNGTPAEERLQAINIENDAFRCRKIRYRNDFNGKNEQRKSTSPNKDNTADTKANNPVNTGTTLRIETHTLDSLITQTGEMIMAHNMMGHEISAPEFEKAISAGRVLLNKKNAGGIDSNDIEKWNSIISYLSTTHKKIIDNNDRMRKTVSAIQNRILDLRVIPVSVVFNRIPQLVKKMAESQSKKINLITEGKEVRIDKGMVDVLMEPLIHLVRNCIDHGIETPQDRTATGKPEEATLTLSAFQEGSTLVLEIADDGRGINLEKIRESAVRKGFIQPSDNLSDQETCKLIFLPGFSTADVITETSGRGVGMDVVITRINHIGGDIDVQTHTGHGTRFIMTLPLSAAIQSVIMVKADERQYAIPQSSVIEILSLSPDSVCSILGQSAFILRTTAIPLFNLNDLVLKRGITTRNSSTTLQFPPVSITEHGVVIVIGQGLQRIAVLVDAIESREDIFVRELHKDLRSLPAICGVTALGNGEIAFILNSNFLLQYAEQGLVAWLNTPQAIT